MLTAARDRARARLEAFGRGADRFGLIHGDFLPENVYACAEGTRLLDFDDCGESWYIFELAISVYFLRSQPNYDLICASYVGGYRRVRALPDEHLAMMPDMLMARGLKTRSRWRTSIWRTYRQPLPGSCCRWHTRPRPIRYALELGTLTGPIQCLAIIKIDW